MRLRLAGGLDLATVALVLGGALLVAASVVAAVVTLSPVPAQQPVEAPGPTTTRPSEALRPDHVAAVISLEPTAAAGAAARPGDHIDLLGYFPRPATGSENVTRVLVEDVAVLSVDRDGGSVALTLALRQESALLVHEAQALGAKPYIALRPDTSTAAPGAIAPATFSDSDLARRLTGAP